MPFGLLFRALDDLKPNEVYVCGGASPNYAIWGELMTTRAIHLGARGAVLDGYSRDTARNSGAGASRRSLAAVTRRILEYAVA